MSTYKLVASDLDGTLLKNDQTLSPENAAAIAEMAGRGIHFAISTGRTYGEILPALRADPHIRFVIHSDGAVIYDKQTDTRYTACFSGSTQKLVLDTLFGCRSWFTVRYNGVSYYDGEHSTVADFDFHRITPYYRALVADCNVPMADFQAFCYGMEEIEQITVFSTTMMSWLFAKRLSTTVGCWTLPAPRPTVLRSTGQTQARATPC